MAQCKNCEQSGIFFSVNQDGLCASCSRVALLDISQRIRLINDSRKLVDESKNLDVRLDRYDFLMENLYRLYEYERKGIPTCSPKPSEFLNKYQGQKDTIILGHWRSALEAVKEKLDITSSAKAKINQLTKILLKLPDYKSKISDRAPLTAMEAKIKELIHRIEVRGYIEAAEKAEFKGQLKKALDQYYEALYFLKHDDIEDSLQAEHISEIERKIADLKTAVEKP